MFTMRNIPAVPFAGNSQSKPPNTGWRNRHTKRGLLSPRFRVRRRSSQGNSVAVIEHNPEIIKTADHILDLGPGGGVRGGKIVAQGTPEDVAEVPESYTGQYLKPMLERQREAAE